MATLAGRPELCFALAGLGTLNYSFDFGEIARLRQLQHPPGEVELAGALRNKALLSAVARHMPSVTHELAVRCSVSDDKDYLVTLGWWIISALRTRTLADILVPAVSSISWDAIPAVDADSCDIHLIEDVPAARRFGQPAQISKGSLDWVNSHLLTWADLLERPAFRLAVDSLTTHHQQTNLRMSASALWAGFEALFGVNAELRFRLSALAAAYLEDRGPERLTLYRRIKQLYDHRSKVVHGAAISEPQLETHIIEVRELLSRLMCRITEVGSLPSTENYEEQLFT